MYPNNAEHSTTNLIKKNLEVMEERIEEEEHGKRRKYEYDICARTLDSLALFVFVSVFLLITMMYFILSTASYRKENYEWKTSLLECSSHTYAVYL